MNSVYIIVENGEAYNIAYTSYASAVAAVKEKNKITLLLELQECGKDGPSTVDVPENKLTGITHLYIEKEISIYIHKLPILSF